MSDYQTISVTVDARSPASPLIVPKSERLKPRDDRGDHRGLFVFNETPSQGGDTAATWRVQWVMT